MTCKICDGGFGLGVPCEECARRVAWLAIVGGQPSVALSLLALWERPWSSTALRWATHVLFRCRVRGIDVLEHPIAEL